MARPRSVPSLCRHKASGQAVVRLDGRDHYLGKYGTPEAQAAYHRLIGEWLAASAPTEISLRFVTELIAAYTRHAERYYRRDGRPTSQVHAVKAALQYLQTLYGDLPLADFGPRRLKAVRQSMIRGGLARRTINARIRIIVRAFRWAASNELIGADLWHRLRTVEGLRRGRGGRETEPRRPVAWSDVAAVRPHVSAQVWAMIRLQWHTGMRPGEVVRMRTSNVDRSGRSWLYRPASHKTAWRGHDRVIVLGPRAQDALAPWLRPAEPEAPLFQPIEAERAWRAALVAERKARGGVGNHKRPAQRPRHRPGRQYSVCSYRRAIARACEKAGVARWTPHQIRHTFKMRAARAGGLEAARAALGHRSVSVTAHYGELDRRLAETVASRIG